MPIYEYLCSGCRMTFEVMRPLSRSSDTAPCPECRETGRRVLSLFATATASTERPGCAMAPEGAGPACTPDGCGRCAGG